MKCKSYNHFEADYVQAHNNKALAALYSYQNKPTAGLSLYHFLLLCQSLALYPVSPSIKYSEYSFSPKFISSCILCEAWHQGLSKRWQRHVTAKSKFLYEFSGI